MTFTEKIDGMRKDLASIVSRMNADGNHEVATRAQEALCAVDKIATPFDTWFDDLDWKWKPPK